MKIPLAFIALATAAPIALSAVEPTLADSRVESVALFSDGARVTRVATLEAPAGKSVLRFENLPSSVDPSVFQASLGDAKGVIRNAKIFRPEDPKPSLAIEALKEKLAVHQRETRAIEETKKLAKDSIEFVEELGESFADRFGELSDAGETLTIEQGLETWALVEKTRREARKTIEDADDALRERSKTEEEIQRELQKAMETQAKTQFVGEVEIELDSAQKIELAISYQTFAANWQPQYELRANPKDAQLDFGYFAKIWQNTGEDWTDVELSLQTNQANRQGNVPELGPMMLRPYQSASSYPRKQMRSMDLLSESVGHAEAEMAPSKRQVAITQTTVSFQVTLPSAVTVPSSKDGATIPITDKSLTAEYWTETVPKLQLAAYLRAETINDLPLPILPGQALAFVDGKLSSKVYLTKTLPSETLELSLGADPNIVVERIEGAQEDKNSGFLDKTVTLTRTYTNKLVNHHPVDHRVIVVDQFPIAQDAKIEITRIAPKESEVTIEEEEKDSGIFRWETTLAPKQSKSFKTEYEVVHPRDWQIAPTP